MAKTYEPIATTTLGSATSSITFTAIPSTYTDLVLVFNGSLVSADYVVVQVGNGSIDTGNNYSKTQLYGNGSTATSSRGSNQPYFYQPEPMNTNQNNMIINFMNYANTSVYKTMLMRGNTPLSDGGATGTVTAEVALWRNSTAAIERIKVSTYAAANFNIGTVCTIYGIKAA